MQDFEANMRKEIAVVETERAKGTSSVHLVSC
jgi:hypothetical protein